MLIVPRKKISLTLVASILLFVAAVLAAIIANSPVAYIYHDFLSQELQLQIGSFNLFSHGGHSLTMIEFVNDCLMTIFFLSVGLEIKRELLVGELSSFKRAVLPFISACGGMIFPVVVYFLLINHGTPDQRGMAIPIATDIAFSLGVLSLLGKHVPLSLKVFLTAFAVVDDIGGILVIALFYSSEVYYGYLIAAGVLYVFIYFLGRTGVTQKIYYLCIGVVIWYLFMQSGIHSTISGVILAFVIPARPRMNVGKYIKKIRRTINKFPVAVSDDIVLTNRQISLLKQVGRASDYVISPLQSLEDNLHGIVNFVILPLFAFANAGVVLNGGNGQLLGDVTLAVTFGLLLGKFIGIFSFTWLAIKTKIAIMPKGMNWKNIAGVSFLGGIGFTVSLFIANLSFGDAHSELLNQAKLGIIAGSILSGTAGYFMLRTLFSHKEYTLD